MSTTTTTTKSSRASKSAYCVAPPCPFKPLRKRTSAAAPPTSTFSSHISFRKALPASFDGMYAADVLQNAQQLTPAGRPLFTQRAIVDWEKNDMRSLLIVDALRPEWKGKVPHIIEPGYRIQVLPLDAPDAVIIDALVASDMYKEHGFETAFLLQTAHYTVQAARMRQSVPNAPFTKPEWRNIIENYLLNLACEAQCRLDFQKTCAYIKDARRQATKTTKPVPTKPASPNSTSPLLRKALLASSPGLQSQMESAKSKHSAPKQKVTLSKTEKQHIWVKVQSDLYARLGLNWQPDELI